MWSQSSFSFCRTGDLLIYLVGSNCKCSLFCPVSVQGTVLGLTANCSNLSLKIHSSLYFPVLLIGMVNKGLPSPFSPWEEEHTLISNLQMGRWDKVADATWNSWMSHFKAVRIRFARKREQKRSVISYVFKKDLTVSNSFESFPLLFSLHVSILILPCLPLCPTSLFTPKCPRGSN